jgi:MFS family permease
MNIMPTMTTTEKRAIVSLSSIMALRMLGLFMVLPVFSIYAAQLKGATATTIGIALGIYGLSQALLQIPFGTLSDHFGRKPIILIGLLLFSFGSFMAYCAHSITLMIIGRALQGAGAVGSTMLAMVADLTREEQRTKAMAITGITIGFSFSLAMLFGPLLMKWVSVNELFLLAMIFGFLCILILLTSVPTPIHIVKQPQTESKIKSFFHLCTVPELAKLNTGIFILHTIFTASFVVIPISLLQLTGLPTAKQWTLYLPTLLTAFTISLLCIQKAEKKQQIKPYFLAGITILAISLVLLWITPTKLTLVGIGLGCFFTGFSLLEAFLPSLVSRMAPAQSKGSALGLFSFAQFSGIFVGGTISGWLYSQFNFSGVYFFCITLTLVWLILASFMKIPRYLVTELIQLSPVQLSHWGTIACKLELIPGIREITFVKEDGIAYLKMERNTKTNLDFIRLKEQLSKSSTPI